MSKKAMYGLTHLKSSPTQAGDPARMSSCSRQGNLSSPRDSLMSRISFGHSRWCKGGLALAVALGLAFPAHSARAEESVEAEVDVGAAAPELPTKLPSEALPLVSAGQLQGLEADGSYTIRKGDTLWDLSETYLNNPWYWPKIWAENPYIENPHWIYPGDPLLFPMERNWHSPQTVAQGQEPQQEDDQDDWAPPLRDEPEELAEVTMGSVHKADNLGQGDDLVSISGGKRLGFEPRKKGTHVQVASLLSDKELEASGTIVGSFQERALLSTFDQVYVRFENLDKVKVGDRFSIFRPGNKVIHPKTRKQQGVMTTIVGNLQVVGKDAGLAVAQIDSVLEYAERGDRVGEITTLVKDLLPVPNTASAKGFIIGTHISNQMQIGDYHLVYLDCGSKQGVKPGNTLEVLHSGDGLGQVLNRKDKGDKEPQEVVAQLMVFDVREDSSTALVLRSIRETRVGDRVRMEEAEKVASAH